MEQQFGMTRTETDKDAEHGRENDENQVVSGLGCERVGSPSQAESVHFTSGAYSGEVGHSQYATRLLDPGERCKSLLRGETSDFENR